jgi:hypothetical protein
MFRDTEGLPCDTDHQATLNLTLLVVATWPSEMAPHGLLLCWGVQSIAGWAAYNSEQLGQHQDPVSWVGYLAALDFWNRTFQNWQSEMLAVGSMAVLSVYLRQRGSPESKPVGAAHDDTGQTG